MTYLRLFKVLLLEGIIFGLVILAGGCGEVSGVSPGPQNSPTANNPTPLLTLPAQTTASSPGPTATSPGQPLPTLIPTTSPPTRAVNIENTSSPTPTPHLNSGLTMKEAYALAKPQMEAWQPDQVFFSIFNSLESGIGIEPDGRSNEWNFQAVSIKLSRRVTWLVKSGKGLKPTVSRTGDEELSPAEAQSSTALPPVTQLIDSNQLMEIARQNGGDKSDTPVGFFLRQPVKAGEPLTVDLVFYKGNNALSLRIDMKTGKLVPNVKG